MSTPQPISTMGRVVGINLGVLLLYMLLIFFTSNRSGHDAELGLAAGMAFLLLIHIVLLLLLAIVLAVIKRGDLAKSMLVSFAVVLLVGFGSCVGLLSVA